ncbi:unnamed protein product [Coccothraustes coccothraustes]
MQPLSFSLQLKNSLRLVHGTKLHPGKPSAGATDVMEKLVLLDLLFLHLCKEKWHSLTSLALLPVHKLLFPAPFVGTGAFDSCPIAGAARTWHKDPGAEITGVQQGGLAQFSQGSRLLLG